MTRSMLISNKNDDQKINESTDSFQVFLKTVLMQIYS